MYFLNSLLKAILCFILFFNFSFLVAQSEKRNNGLITLQAKTQYGSIYTYLPENYVQGKPISGSFFIEPIGSSTREIQKNTKKMLEYGLQIGESKINIKDKLFSTILTSDQIDLAILDGNGKLIQSFKTILSNRIQPKKFSFPKGVKSEDRSQVIGNFDGNLKNTSLLLNGHRCNVLAESPIQVLFKAPKLSTGNYNFKVNENNIEVASGKIQVVNYELTAGRLNLKRGQSTHIQATITGLNFLEKPIPLTVTNLSPAVVSLQGGNLQTIMIPRQEGAFIKRWSVRSLKTGSFSISTELKLPDTKFPVVGVSAAVAVDGKDPCAVLKKSCDKLLADLNAKKAIAKTAKDKADIDKRAADKLKKIADDLERDAKKAEREALPPDEGATIKYEGYTYKLIDHKLLNVLRKDAYADYRAGNSNINQYQDRIKKLSGPDALKEVEKNRKKLEARLKEKAKKARQVADNAKEPYNAAKTKADASKEIADNKQADVDAAQKAYDECMKKVKEECDKILAQKAKEEANRIKKEEEARVAAAEAERLRIAEEKRKQGVAKRKAKAMAYQKYLLDNIKELGLIGSSGIKEVPGLWDWLPNFLESPVGNFVEGVGKSPIPTDVLKALGGLYKIAGALLDPCTALGARKTIERLEEMTNPRTRTKRKYTDKEAMKKTEDMCKLLRKLKAKSLQLKKATGG